MSGLKVAILDVLTFAQDGAGAAPADGPGVPGEQANPLVQMAPMLIMFVVLFYFIVMRPQQKEQRKRQELLGALKKNDKVLTIGGIIGTIVDFSGDGQRVTLRVDDGTRIRFTRSSIQGPYDEKAEADPAEK
ncbi:MAG: preprotein translocase subunit YajC [Fuerstiella sp.]